MYAKSQDQCNNKLKTYNYVSIFITDGWCHYAVSDVFLSHHIRSNHSHRIVSNVCEDKPCTTDHVQSFLGLNIAFDDGVYQQDNVPCQVRESIWNNSREILQTFKLCFGLSIHLTTNLFVKQ